jgi:DeoR/GlpR family transcriptional regulator of sugar metabolism
VVSMVVVFVVSLEIAGRGSGVQELNHEDVLLGLIQVALHVFHELGDANVVVLEELDDVHSLAVLCLALRHVSVLLQEFCHGDITIGGGIMEHVVGVLVDIVLKELDNRHIHIAFVDIGRAGIRVVSRCSSI